MYVPEAGRLPMAVWASRMQQVQGEREQNRANMTKFMSDLGKGIKTADPYQESLNQATAAARNRFVGDLAAQYGGNDALAWKEIAEDPQTQQRFIDLHRKFEAIGQHGMQSWERARGYLDALEKGGVHVDPETKRLAEEVYYGLGSMRGDEDIADIDKLVRNINKFEHSVSRDEYAKQWLLPSLEKRYRQYATDVQTRRQNGIGILEWNQVFDGKAFIEEAARSMTDAIAGSTYEENKQWMERNFPAENIQKKVKTYALPKPSKGGGGGDGSMGSASGWGRQPSQRATPGAPYSPDATFEFVSAPLEKVGDKMVPPTPIKLNKKGNPMGALVMITGFEKDDNGEWHVLGEEVTTKQINEFNVFRRSLGGDGVTLAQFETSPELTAEYNTWRNSQSTTTGIPYDEKLSSNTAQISGKFGSSDPYVLSGVSQRIAQYNKANNTSYTADDFGKMRPEDQEAIMNGQPIQKATSGQRQQQGQQPPPGGWDAGQPWRTSQAQAPKDDTKYSIKGKTYTWKELQKMGYTADQVSKYMSK